MARRIKALEQAFGARLFDRFQRTEQSLELLHEVKQMERVSQSIDRRAAGLGTTHLGSVRISIDETMADFLGRHLGSLRDNHRCIELEIVVAHTSADLSKREADLLTQPRIPDLASVVRRKLACFAYAVYGTAACADVCDSDEAALRAFPLDRF